MRHRKLRAALTAAGLTLAIAPATAHATLSSTPARTAVTNGPVYAVAPTPSAIYIGGDFTQVGPRTGPGVGIDASTGQSVGLPEVAGGGQQVLTAVADGKGGFFIGGDFSLVGGVRRANLAHILPRGAVDPRFHPDPDARVMALALSGKRLYVGGFFDSIGGKRRKRIAAVKRSSGAVTRWNPRVSAGDAPAGGYIAALDVSGSKVYAGGAFTKIGGKHRRSIAALKVRTGKATRWNPRATGRFGDVGGIQAIVARHKLVYAGGAFSTIGGKHRRNIAALKTSNGRATSWNPGAVDKHKGNTAVDAITVARRTVFIGGRFASTGGADRNGIAAIRAATGKATHWDPNPPQGSRVGTLVRSGSTVYAGGAFNAIGGEPRNGLAALGRRNGQARGWDPDPNGLVEALAVSGPTVYAGGQFNSIGGQTRNNLAALDPSTGAVTKWNPNVTGDESVDPCCQERVHVAALATSGSTVYAGGLFDSIGGKSRSSLAGIDAMTGKATSWNPQPDGTVSDIEGANGTVYVAGDFSSIGGQDRRFVAALDPATGAATPWDPHPNSYVNAITVSGSTVYVGGSFSSIGGQSRQSIAALNATTGAATVWNPSADAAGSTPDVRAVAQSGSKVYVAGLFDGFGGQPRRYIAALNASTGAATAFDPSPDAQVGALAIAGPTVYAGGYFGSIGGESRSGLAALDAGTGAANGWNPRPNGRIASIAVANDGSIWVGGSFTGVGTAAQSGIAEFRPAGAGVLSPTG
jgi:trimeric autotransporter adhesin